LIGHWKIAANITDAPLSRARSRAPQLAHPEAFDFVFGNLPSGATAEFSDHLEGCPHCQSIVAEYSEIGRIVQSLPPHVEPPADLEDRTVAAVLRALADSQSRPISLPRPRTWL
jgi:anti-sigma factor RsiW